MFHRRWREQAVAALDQPFDMVIVGGGITGCGIFFDAAQRGLKVLLVEQGDLASGTSSRSSKLLHGGLRYLKNLQLGVTRKSCRERDRQLALNPHLVTPIPWLYPTYRGHKTPGWKAELGLRIYDRLTDRPEKHRRLEPEEVDRMAPGLTVEDLDRALLYQDARVDDAQLTWSVAATGAAYGGWLLTYARAEEARRSNGQLRSVVVRDLSTDKTHEVETDLVVNAAGAWVDGIRHRFGLEGRTVRPSRGSHLIFDRERIPIEGAVTILSPDDQRPVFLIPHPEGVLLGTTDLFHHGDLADPRPTRDEVDYLLRVLKAGYPDNPPGVEDIRGAFAGVRPVLDNETDDPSAASREEAIWYEDGLLSVAGGKLTTWRSTAEDVVDKALRYVSRRVAPCATLHTPLLGMAPASLGHRLDRAFNLEPGVGAAMAKRLGARAWQACEAADSQELRPLHDGLDLSAAELRHHVRHGAITHLSDLLLRRVRLGMWRPDQARALAPTLGELLRSDTAWSVDRFDCELERFTDELEAWTLEGVEPGAP